MKRRPPACDEDTITHDVACGAFCECESPVNRAESPCCDNTRPTRRNGRGFLFYSFPEFHAPLRGYRHNCKAGAITDVFSARQGFTPLPVVWNGGAVMQLLPRIIGRINEPVPVMQSNTVFFSRVRHKKKLNPQMVLRNVVSLQIRFCGDQRSSYDHH